MPITLPVLPALPVPTPVDEGDCPPPDDNTVPPVPPVPPPPKPPPILGDGNGNLLYVSTLKGLACCLQAWGTDGSDGEPIWSNVNGESPNNLAGDALKIRYFDLDPWSGVTDELGYHLDAGYANTDDGLYRVTGLPKLPVWTRILTTADAVTVGSVPLPTPTTDRNTFSLTANFCTSTYHAGFIATQLLLGLDYGQRYGGAEVPSYGIMSFLVYSWDYGETWALDNSLWTACNGVASIGDQRFNLFMQASDHEPDVYTIGSHGSKLLHDQATDLYTSPSLTFMQSPGTRGANFPDVSGGMASGYNALNLTYGRICSPYSDSSGAIYSNDNVAYLYRGTLGAHSGEDTISRYNHAFDPLYSNGYTPPTRTAVGDAAMGDLHFFDTNRKNEDYGVGINTFSTGYLWFTSDLTSPTPTWTQYITPTTSSTRGLIPYNLFYIPKNKLAIFLVGVPNGFEGSSIACFTKDFGVTFTDFSQQGVAGGLDGVMGLATYSGNPMTDTRIVVDAYYVGNPFLPPGAHGVDVSHYQGTMNWATALAAGVTFAFIKSSQGISSSDSAFSTYWSGAGAQGIDRGPYHYYMNSLDPTSQANHFVATAVSGGELGYAVDCEDETASLTPANLKTFLDRVEALTGQKCIIYTRASWWNSYVGFQSWAADYPLWVANWNAAVPTLPNGWSSWDYWQTSSQGNGSTYGASSSFIDLDKRVGGL